MIDRNYPRFQKAVYAIAMPLLWTAMAWARIYPPCQSISYTVPAVNTITYSVVDPVTGQTQSDGWVMPAANEQQLGWVKNNQGILSWIAAYRNAGDAYYTYQVQYRLYDPGRGMWINGHWGPFTGYEATLGQYENQDGVVTWKAQRRKGASPTDKLEHFVHFVTYDPKLGSWPLGTDKWQVAYNSNISPEVLRVKNGIVAWPMNPCNNEHDVVTIMQIYDQELHRWVRDDGWTRSGFLSFDWLAIDADAVQVHERWSSWLGNTIDYWHSYNANSHSWSLDYGNRPTPVRRAYFIAQPDSGIVPFRVWFWDCSTALDGTWTPSVWVWEFAPGQTLTARTGSYRYTSAGQYTVTQAVGYVSGGATFTATGNVNAQAPAMPPNGGVSINNEAVYTNSPYVTLSLNYSADTTQMCFRGTPGSIKWTDWQPVGPSIDWSLSMIHPLGETADGWHTVSVKFRNEAGLESRIFQDNIILDTTPPEGTLTLNGGASNTDSPIVQANWSASDNYIVTEMSYQAYDAENPPANWWVWQNYNPTTMNFTFSSKPGWKMVCVRFKDMAGNISQVQAGIILNPRIYLPLVLRN